MSTKITEGQLDFLGLLSEYTDDQGATVRVREPRSRQVRPMMPKIPERTVERDTDPEQMTLEMFQILSHEPAVADKPVEPKTLMPTMVSPVIPEKPTTKATDIESKSALKVSVKATDNETVKTPDVVKAKPEPETLAAAPKKGDMLFKRCVKCWCYDCKHNARNEAVVRDICGTMMACPACEDCIRDDSATICEIGNAKEGCRLRAMEEGIVDAM